MNASVTPMRLRYWTPPAYGAMFRRKTDGTIWTVRGIYRQDQQVRLERQGERPEWPFANMLNSDYEQVG